MMMMLLFVVGVCCFFGFSCHALLVLSLRSLSSRRGDVPCTWWVGWMPATLNWNGTCVEKSLMPAELKFCEDGHFFDHLGIYMEQLRNCNLAWLHMYSVQSFFLLFHDIPWATHDCKWPYKPTSFGKWVILQAIRPYAQAHGSWNRVPDLLKTNLEQLQCHLQRHFRNRVPDLFFETFWSSYRCRNSRDGNQGLKWGPTFNGHANWNRTKTKESTLKHLHCLIQRFDTTWGAEFFFALTKKSQQAWLQLYSDFRFWHCFASVLFKHVCCGSSLIWCNLHWNRSGLK